MYSDEYPGVVPEFKFPRALTVSEINDFIKRIFDGMPQFSDLLIQGEISNFKNHYATGHFYFTLKDESSAIRAVMFRSYAERVKFVPENGMKVTVHGRISAYPRDGQYQIYCDTMEPLGVGSLFAAFEQLKNKLSKEGLFDEAHKKTLPRFPETVGVVTSATGAAVRDIINISRRRWPIAKILIYPALVQGEGAAKSVAGGIEYFNATNSADVIIIGRGGGSIEDLWAFNDEALARTVYASEIPVISAVGHETDFTISDFVADLRAPTPSAAAELALPNIEEVKEYFLTVSARIAAALNHRLENYRTVLSKIGSSRVLTDPMAYVEDRTLQLSNIYEKLLASEECVLNDKTVKIKNLAGLLNAFSPLSAISRGYGAVTDGGGKIIKSVKSVSVGDVVNISLSDGRITAVAKEISEDMKNGE